LASLWRGQTFLPGTIGCHEPGYVLRFYTGPFKRAEITLCWHCSNASFPAVFDESLIVFDASGTNGQALLKTLLNYAPQPSDADFNYTKAPISKTEVEQRIAEAVKHGRDFDRWNALAEFAGHSPQRGQIETMLGSKLQSEANHEVLAALVVLNKMGSTRFGRRLSKLMGHPDRDISDWAGRSLLEHGGAVSAPDLLENMAQADQTVRFLAFATLVKHAPLEPADWTELSNRTETVLTEFGTNAFPETYHGNRIRLSEERRSQAWPTIQRIAGMCGTNFIRNFPASGTEKSLSVP
jgi:hypothetical protein